MINKIFIGSDHAGIELKKSLIGSFPQFQWQDLGPFDSSSVDYPDFADRVCRKVISTPNSFGVLICGSGQGMSIRANKYLGIRAALCWSTEIAELSRKHNNANVLCLGARFISEPKAVEILQSFLSTAFEGGRHQQRVDKLSYPTNNDGYEKHTS